MADKVKLPFKRWNLTRLPEEVSGQLRTSSLRPQQFFSYISCICSQFGDSRHGSDQWTQPPVRNGRRWLAGSLKEKADEECLHLLPVASASPRTALTFELQQEIAGKMVGVAQNGLVEMTGGDALPANQEHRRFGSFELNERCLVVRYVAAKAGRLEPFDRTPSGRALGFQCGILSGHQCPLVATR
jgi:hypothetical protein